MAWAANPYATRGSTGKRFVDIDVITALESAVRHPANTSGYPVVNDPVSIAGTPGETELVGVALETPTAATQYLAIDTSGVWELPVVAADDDANSAVASWDRIYIDNVGILSKKISGTFYGWALTTLSASGTAANALVLLKGKGFGHDPSQLITQTLVANGEALEGGITLGDGNGATVVITVNDGRYVGQISIIRAIDVGNAVTASVTTHETSSPEVFTFAAVGDSIILMWNGLEWVTVGGNASTA